MGRAHRGELSLHPDARPEGCSHRYLARYGQRGADGPADLRRCGLRQNRGGDSGGAPGHWARQAGRHAGADDGVGVAALRDVRGAFWGLAGSRGAALALFLRPRGQRDRQGSQRWHGRHRYRDAPLAL